MSGIIRKATIQDLDQLLRLSKQTFYTSHGHSASPADIENYVSKNLNASALASELKDSENHFYLIFCKGELAGYSKIAFNVANSNLKETSITKMERLYIVKEFYGSGIANQLLEYNIDFTKSNLQSGMWLNVWVENIRALKFYTKMGFKKIGDYKFKISDNHSNPNHVMFLDFDH